VSVGLAPVAFIVFHLIAAASVQTVPVTRLVVQLRLREMLDFIERISRWYD
jgi:hypothetical protein